MQGSFFDAPTDFLTYAREAGYVVTLTDDVPPDLAFVPAATEPMRNAVQKHRERLVQMLRLEAAVGEPKIVKKKLK